jgi:hypothetical protein
MHGNVSWLFSRQARYRSSENRLDLLFLTVVRNGYFPLNGPKRALTIAEAHQPHRRTP